MSDLFWLTPEQLRRIEPYFPLSHGIPRVDDLRVVSGIVHVIRNGLRWRDAPVDYGPHKTLHYRFVRWSRMDVFDRIFAEPAEDAGAPDRVMIDSTHLKAKGITPCIPPIKSRKRPLPYDKTLYKTRRKIENMFAKLKDWRSAFMQMGQAVQTVWVPQRDILPSPLYPPHYRFG